MTLALEAYMCRHRNQQLLDRINASCDEANEDSDDGRARLRGIRRHQRNVALRDLFVIRQGDVYWIDLGEPAGSAPALRRPHVVVQNAMSKSSSWK